jgi:ADP-ribose pyrophosphatase
MCENSQFEIFFDDIEEENGMTVNNYLTVAPRRKINNLITGVGVLAILNGKFVLVKIYRHAVKSYSWEVPRGFVENRESVVDSVLRELKEETGLYCNRSDIDSLGFITPDAGIIAARIHLFVAKRCIQNRSFIVNETGHRELGFFTDAQMKDAVKSSMIQDPSTLAAYFRYIFNRVN